jgi:hypothetical protein
MSGIINKVKGALHQDSTRPDSTSTSGTRATGTNPTGTQSTGTNLTGSSSIGPYDDSTLVCNGMEYIFPAT